MFSIEMITTESCSAWKGDNPSTTMGAYIDIVTTLGTGHALKHSLSSWPEDRSDSQGPANAPATLSLRPRFG